MAAAMTANSVQLTTLTMQNQGYHQHQYNNYNRPGYRFKAPVRVEDVLIGEGPGRRLRKNVANVRRHVDFVPCVLNHIQSRLWQLGKQNRVAAQPDELYQNTALPPSSLVDKPVDCVLTKFVRAAMNKVKCPVYTLAWTPEGKRLITGASTGEFTLWNGTAFNFETILQAHDVAVRSMTWSHNAQWLASGDADGFIKYWQPNMNNVHMFHAHKDDAIRGLKFAPSDAKFATGSDDGTARIWDFARYTEEFTLRGHGSEIRCLDWHPATSLVCTGSRDTQQPVKMWDAASGKCVITLQHHKSSVMAVEFNQNGNWLLTASRDQLIKLYDIRTMKVLKNYRGHKKEVTALSWHPVHESLFVTGGGDGSIAYWLVDNPKEVALLEHAHDQAIWCMRWHPLGHILATGSNDNNTKFWARNRPGDTQEDIFGLASFTSNLLGAADYKEQRNMYKEQNQAAAAFIPGMGLDEDVYQSMNRDVGSVSHSALQLPEDLNSTKQGMQIGAKRTLIKQPPPKRAQRQFERMWNVAKPGGGGEDDLDDVIGDIDPFGKREKTSLLGAPPTSSSSMLGGGSTQITSVPPPSKPSMLGPPPARYGGPPRGSLLKTPTAPGSQGGQAPPSIPGGLTRLPPQQPGGLGGPHDREAPPQAALSSSIPSSNAPPGAPPAFPGTRPSFPPPPGMWPPGIPMPPNIAALHQQQTLPKPEPLDEDVDYRQTDEDLRGSSGQHAAAPSLPPSNITSSVQPRTSEQWRNGHSQGQSQNIRRPPSSQSDYPAASGSSQPVPGGYSMPPHSAQPSRGPPPHNKASGPPANKVRDPRAAPEDVPGTQQSPFDFPHGGMPPLPHAGPPPSFDPRSAPPSSSTADYGDVDARISNASQIPPKQNRLPPPSQGHPAPGLSLPPPLSGPPGWIPPGGPPGSQFNHLPPSVIGQPPLPSPSGQNQGSYHSSSAAQGGYKPPIGVVQGHGGGYSGGSGGGYKAPNGGTLSGGYQGAAPSGQEAYQHQSDQSGGYQQQQSFGGNGYQNNSSGGGRGGFQGGGGPMRGGSRGRGRGYANRPY